MAQSAFANIKELIQDLGIVKNKQRQTFLSLLLEGMIKGRTVRFPELSYHIASSVKEKSTERRIERFFKEVELDYIALGRFLLSFIHHQSYTISIDRTEWDFGKTQINILCATVQVGKMGVPIYFEMLDNNSGNSNYQDRIDLLENIMKIVDPKKIELLVMDREFVGHKWFHWLKEQSIPFCARVPESHLILTSSCAKASAKEMIGDCKREIKYQNVVIDNELLNLSLSYGKDNELLYLVGNIPANQLKDSYKKRWSIEVFFQAIKERGFYLESSNLRSLKKYRLLFALVCSAYSICWATGIHDARERPVKRKKHGYPQFSVFRRGLNIIRVGIKNQCLNVLLQAISLARARLNLIR